MMEQIIIQQQQESSRKAKEKKTLLSVIAATLGGSVQLIDFTWVRTEDETTETEKREVLKLGRRVMINSQFIKSINERNADERLYTWSGGYWSNGHGGREKSWGLPSVVRSVKVLEITLIDGSSYMGLLTADTKGIEKGGK